MRERKSIHMLIKTLFHSSGSASRRCFAPLIVHHQLNSITHVNCLRLPASSLRIYHDFSSFFLLLLPVVAAAEINISIWTKCLRHNKSIIQVSISALHPHIIFIFFSLLFLHWNLSYIINMKKEYLKNDRIEWRTILEGVEKRKKTENKRKKSTHIEQAHFICYQ